ncbi:hypothetical protein IWQ60_005478 [Tieghemiomyces parasiticus]|uniref:Uncharacterized protein n=1 Tax=Tieghemiomyces parasiticus TaxID=78921 RepID=A0A9W8DY68_9FUNG|nr:hypothetical protein IWQ60_005478 [Tieghemiomyces parasiticus]
MRFTFIATTSLVALLASSIVTAILNPYDLSANTSPPVGSLSPTMTAVDNRRDTTRPYGSTNQKISGKVKSRIPRSFLKQNTVRAKVAKMAKATGSSVTHLEILRDILNNKKPRQLSTKSLGGGRGTFRVNSPAMGSWNAPTLGRGIY